MKVLNLICLERSNIKYTLLHFPDGEVQITLEAFSHKDTIDVHCRITNAEELFILMQVADILNRHEVEWFLNIYYLMSGRMDRIMNFNRPFTLKIVTNIIKGFNCKRVYLLEPHSERSYNLLENCGDMDIYNEIYNELGPLGPHIYDDYLVVYPDRGAYERYRENCTVIAEKVRNLATGRIESIRITNPELFKDNTKSIMVVDDLCDAGGTFVGLAEEIRKYTDRELNVFVTHMVNRKGIENLSKVYNHVYFTNSYRDWDNLPENVTQINII